MFKNYVYVEYDSEAPKRRSPNIFNYKLKWTKTANAVSTLSKCVLMRPTKIMVPSKRRTSKYVVFPQRQPYFTYGDLRSSGLANLAFQVSILQCKIWRYSDFLKMCLKPLEFEYFCITWSRLWQNEARCDRQIVSSNELKLPMWLRPWQKCRPSKPTVPWKRRFSKHIVFSQRQPYIFHLSWACAVARPCVRISSSAGQ